MTRINKNIIKRDARGFGFCVRGNFITVVNTDDVVSGFAIDASPTHIYMWTFILPAFDKLDFLHMSLGDRILDFNEESVNFETLLSQHPELFSIQDADQLLLYLDRRNPPGDYATWTRLLCLVRLGRFEEVNEILPLAKEAAVSNDMKLRYEELVFTFKVKGGSAAQDLLKNWSLTTKKLVV